jgi:hypothetical protein
MDYKRRLAFFALLAVPQSFLAEPIAARYVEGSFQAFLALRSEEGKVLASGDLTQVVHGSHVISHLVFKFKDGSVDDETTVFTQHGTFGLISDRHIQKGASFPQPMDVEIDAVAGTVTVRHDGKVEREKMDLPNDLANGIIIDAMKNLSPDTKETTMSWVAATPKPRLVKLLITPLAQQDFTVVGARHKATRFKIKIEIGGIAGVVAPLVGKQPADIYVWIASGASPVFVKSEGAQYLGGPTWRIELSSPVWP